MSNTFKRSYKFKCAVCGKLKTGVHGQKYCNQKCQDKMYKIRRVWNVPTGTVGAIQELRVGADLLMKGYEVFRAMSPCASCDLMILKDKKMLRVEVRTGYERPNKTLTYFNKRFNADIMAVALPDRIVYKPEL